MARQYWITGNHGDPRREERTERICRRAVEIDPEYARAWALMALAQATLRFGFGRDGDGGLTAAKKAIQLDPTIAEAYCVLARHHSEEGRDQEADAEIAKALELDPDSWEVNKEAARLCMLHRRIENATRHYEKAAEVMENDYHAWALLITCYQALGNREGVQHAAQMMVTQAEKAVDEDPSNGAALGVGAGGLAALGQTERAREWIERALLVDPDNLNMKYNFACILATHLHDHEAALKLLNENFAKVTGVQIKLAETDPDLDPLRDDPRFQKMLAEAKTRLGWAPAAANSAEVC
jgi:adenylate cyclase